MATKPSSTAQDGRKPLKKKSSASGQRKLSRLKRPDGMSLEEWQRALRRQFGVEQRFQIENLGAEPVFSEFRVTNPESKNSYRVAIRGSDLGDNFCSCPDFATNTLGTCKHVEFTLASLARRRGGKAALKAGFQPDYSEVYLQYGAWREIRFRPARACPRELNKLTAEFFGADGKLLPEKYAVFDRFLSGARRLDHELRCYDDALVFLAEVRDAERRREQIERAFPQGIGSVAFKNLLKISMYDYQREGALFAARAGRSLIGDEMGLGKTIQALAAAEIMAHELGVDRVLVICPTSLKHQGELEIARFVERSVSVIAGLRARRAAQFAVASFFKIMNYDTVHSDLDLIEAWSPDLVILDEAQRIKNWNTRAARSVKKIKSVYAIVLTGTPLENRLEELVSIVQFVDPHRLGPTFRFLHVHQLLDETGRVVGYRDLDRIGKTLAPILIRRQKKEVLKQLPERLDKNFFVPMTPEQVKHHEENREVVAGIVKRWKRMGFLSEADQRRLMIALQNMRMSCDSTYLLDRVTDFGVKADELVTLLEEIFEQPKAKVVIFSQWLGMHEMLLKRFHERGWGHVLFHGGVPGAQRKALVDRFRADPACRAFLSTDAGGVGLNLQHASIVVNMDLPWNPAVLAETPQQHFVHAQPLAENDHFCLGPLEYFFQQRGQLVSFDAEVGHPVEQIRAVARHAHVLQRDHQTPLVGLAQETHALPAFHDATNHFPVLFMMLHLLRRHRNEEILIEAFGQLLQHVLFLPPNEYRRKGFADAVKLAVAYYPAGLVEHLVLMQKAKRRPESMRVDELDNGNQFFEAVFKRRAGEYDRIGRADLFNAARGPRVPILDALRLVQNHQIGRPRLNEIKITMHRIVVHNLEETRDRELLRAARPQAGDHADAAFYEAGNLALPLVLERGRANHQHAIHAQFVSHDLGRSERLDGLAEPHLVAD